MGWRELQSWLRQMTRDRQGPDPNPSSWEDPTSQENFRLLDEKRKKMRGR